PGLKGVDQIARRGSRLSAARTIAKEAERAARRRHCKMCPATLLVWVPEAAVGDKPRGSRLACGGLNRRLFGLLFLLLPSRFSLAKDIRPQTIFDAQGGKQAKARLPHHAEESRRKNLPYGIGLRRRITRRARCARHQEFPGAHSAPYAPRISPGQALLLPLLPVG